MTLAPKPGTPIWFDLGSSDVPTSAGFYSSVFGWVAEAVGGEETGGYTTYTSGRDLVAAVAPHQIDTPYHRPYGPDGAHGMPAIWTVYFHTDTIDELPGRVTETGGEIIMLPMDVFGLGHMAVFADPAGAAFAVWQPGTMPGATAVNQPGAISHVELVVDEVDAVRDFYSSVLGLVPVGNGPDTGWTVGGTVVAGTRSLEKSAASLPHWHIAVGVEDCQAVLDSAVRSGATLEHGPWESSRGLRADLKDPLGAGFSIVELTGTSA